MVEMIIVIAIMAILSGAAVINLSVSKQAKCTAAANAFNNQLSVLSTQTQALSDNDATVNKKLCMKITNGVQGIASEGVSVNRSYTTLQLGYLDSANNFTQKPDSKTVWISDVVDSIQYTEGSGYEYSGQEHSITTTDGPSLIVMFNKSNGSVQYGAGDYSIMYNGRVMAVIHLDPMTGHHSVN
jgi:type II secretory pathway pseudopilin PulG